MREVIFDAICRVPLAMERAVLLRDLYYNSQTLQLKFQELYSAAVLATLAMVDWLLDSSFWGKTKQALKAFGSQEQYGEILEKQLRLVDVCAISLGATASDEHKQETRGLTTKIDAGESS